MKVYVYLSIIMMFGALLLGFRGGYERGQIQGKIDQQPLEVAQQCAYYSMTTGKFTWGSPPITIDSSLQEGIALPNGVPPKKPAVHK